MISPPVSNSSQDDQKYEKLRALELTANRHDLDSIWLPLLNELMHQGAPNLRDLSGQGFVRAPFGWRAPDPGTIGLILTSCLTQQLTALLPPKTTPTQDQSAPSWELESHRLREIRRSLSMASSALALTSDCGCYDQALAALEHTFNTLPLSINPKPLIETLLRRVLNPAEPSTPDLVAQRLSTLAASVPLWTPSSTWFQSFSQHTHSGLVDPHAERFDIGHWGASLLRAAALRHDCAGAVTFLMGRMASPQLDGLSVDWQQVGARVGAQMGYLFIPTTSWPEEFFKTLPPYFWLGAHSEMGPESKAGKLIYARLLHQARTDFGLKLALCANVWLGLDRKDILALDAAFPSEVAGLLKPALQRELSGTSSSIGAAYRLEKALKRTSGAWARAAFADHGFVQDDVAHKVLLGGADLVAHTLSALYASREAAAIKKHLKAQSPKRTLPKDSRRRL